MQGKNLFFRILKNKGMKMMAVVLSAAMILPLLAGCMGKEKPAEETLPTEAVSNILPDGNPKDVTCKGSYTEENPELQRIVATLGSEQLTGGELNVFYRLAINSWKNQPESPDFHMPLEEQICPLTEETCSWQQYFLKLALDQWTVLQSLQQKSLQYVERQEPYFEPNVEKHEKYMTGMPILPILYSKDGTYRLNEKEEKFLEEIPQQLSLLAEQFSCADGETLALQEFGVNLETLQDVVYLLNYAYFYFISHTYDLQFSDVQLAKAGRETEDGEEAFVTLRQILLLPENSSTDENGKLSAASADWDKTQHAAEEVLRKLRRSHRAKSGKCSEAEFAQKAHDISEDTASRISGGLYENIKKEQLPREIADWAFDPKREAADTVILTTEYGCHILFFRDRNTEKDLLIDSYLLKETLERVLDQAVSAYTANIRFADIQLLPLETQGSITAAEHLLYEDIGYERFTEVPVYLQQDYMKAPYAAGFKVGTHGCGITSFAMLSTYMTDSRMTPATCARDYPKYGSRTGTDSRIFVDIPPEIGYFLDKRTSNVGEVADALKEGKKAISVQHLGHFTRGGHYLVLSDMTEDGQMVIRDSNIYNYERVPEHKEDKCKPSIVAANSQGFWIFDPKVITVPGCSRCGEHSEAALAEHYICPKCHRALDRRSLFIEMCGIPS